MSDRVIWVIDDSVTEHALMRIAFQDLEHIPKIVSLHSAEAAVEALDLGERPSLVLLDLNMPGVGGRLFLEERLARGLTWIPVIVLSSSSSEIDIRNSYAAGANTYVQKPADLDGLRQFANAMAEYWFRLAELPLVS